VGFIRDLPHGLIDAFQATLQEAADADLLLHVVDAANPGHPEQIEEVQRVLQEIGAENVPQVLVFNKIDFCGDAEAQQARREFLQAAYPECFIMSALNTADVALVRQKIVDFFKTQLAEAELYVPWSAQKARGEIFSQCRVQDERSDEHGTFFTVLAEPALIEELQTRFPRPAR
jgi:GTP-binding protein HflX